MEWQWVTHIFVQKNCNKSIFKKELVDTKNLKCYGFGQQAEILSQIIKKSKNNFEIPINYNGRSAKEGKKIRWYHFFSVIFQLTIGRFK